MCIRTIRTIGRQRFHLQNLQTEAWPAWSSERQEIHSESRPAAAWYTSLGRLAGDHNIFISRIKNRLGLSGITQPEVQNQFLILDSNNLGVEILEISVITSKWGSRGYQQNNASVALSIFYSISIRLNFN